jgi:hypothetical protein
MNADSMKLILLISSIKIQIYMDYNISFINILYLYINTVNNLALNSNIKGLHASAF